MIQAVADTHALIWYLFADERISPSARRIFDQAVESGDQVAFSAITLVEIVYLIEKSRIPQDTYDRLLDAISTRALF